MSDKIVVIGLGISIVVAVISIVLSILFDKDKKGKK